MTRIFEAVVAATAALVLSSSARAQSKDAELAKQLTNPVASLISVPLQNNYDCCYGPNQGWRYTLNVQPVVPVSLSKDWNVIVRTITPIISQSATGPGQGAAFGFGDITQSFFFTPKAEKNGLIWALGPAMVYPSGQDDLGGHQWGAGPTALLLKMSGGNTYGVLVNQIWSLGHRPGEPVLNAAFLQPFFTHTFPDTTGVQVNLESTYDWTRRQWTVPMNVGLTHLYSVSGQRISLGAFARAYLARPEGGPDWGVRFVATLLFPTG